uniref:Cysteine-rich DPF motif domain-containing protein 1 n=2 Tax=Parascaris univalens TaxID=6257 RepID=A0A915BN45_PARUN
MEEASSSNIDSTLREERRTEGRINEVEERDEQMPLVPFRCCVCGMKEKCRYGNIKVTGRTHSYRYKEEVYYMMDPFRDRGKADESRLSASSTGNSTTVAHRHSYSNRTPNILDFFVIGALCTICGQAVCIDELCSVFYSKTFCSTCVMRERVHFPIEIVEHFETARAARERREAERSSVNVPRPEDDN